MTVAVVVPLYNEALRFNSGAFRRFIDDDADARLVLVNDGSTDNTVELLLELQVVYPTKIEIVNQPRNSGKAEAVRVGLLKALEMAPYVGFWDADLATPLRVVREFTRILDSRPGIEWVFGSRVKLLGRSIKRSELRHYLGRVFATGASVTLGLGVYDTQCGAKLFRSDELLRSVLQERFVSRWVFDVELAARFVALHHRGVAPDPRNAIFEAPLDEWHDVSGSKVRPVDFLRSGLELAMIWNRYLRPLGKREAAMRD